MCVNKRIRNFCRNHRRLNMIVTRPLLSKQTKLRKILFFKAHKRFLECFLTLINNNLNDTKKISMTLGKDGTQSVPIFKRKGKSHIY